MFNPLHSISDLELFKKHLCNRNSHFEKYGRFLLHATTRSTLFAVSKDEWDTKEETGKSMKNALYVLWYMPKGTSQAEATLNSEKNQARSLSCYHIKLRLSEGISQSVENSVK